MSVSITESEYFTFIKFATGEIETNTSLKFFTSVEEVIVFGQRMRVSSVWKKAVKEKPAQFVSAKVI